jgi:hypothetical protein
MVSNPYFLPVTAVYPDCNFTGHRLLRLKECIFQICAKNVQIIENRRGQEYLHLSSER